MKQTRLVYLFITAIAVFISVSSYSNSQQLKSQYQRIEKLEEAVGKKTLECNSSDMVERVSKSIVRVVGADSEGSGVILNSYGIIVTNHHVIANEPAPKVVFQDYSHVPATILMSHQASDIALIQINKDTPDFLSLSKSSTDSLKVLDPVFSFGFPYGTDVSGAITIQQGHFVSLRDQDTYQAVHTSLSIQPGQSGGALTDQCGTLLGINSSGASGFTYAISTKALLDVWSRELIENPEPIIDVQLLDIDPDESPLSAVKAFYQYQKTGDFRAAYNILSQEFLEWMPYEEWVQGYENTIQVDLISATIADNEEDTVYVKFISKDIIDTKPVYRYFEGTWQVTWVDRFLLAHPKIEQIADPAWDWFWDESLL